MLRDFFLGFIKVHILHHAAQEPGFGLERLWGLTRHGLPGPTRTAARAVPRARGPRRVGVGGIQWAILGERGYA
jgi:hypothetical protein